MVSYVTHYQRPTLVEAMKKAEDGKKKKDDEKKKDERAKAKL